MADISWNQVIVALITAVPSTIAAMRALNRAKETLEQSKNNGYKQDTVITQQDKVINKQDEVIAKTDQIHVLANSNLAKVVADLTLANDRIIKLEALVRKLVNEANMVDKLIEQEKSKHE